MHHKSSLPVVLLITCLLLILPTDSAKSEQGTELPPTKGKKLFDHQWSYSDPGPVSIKDLRLMQMNSTVLMRNEFSQSSDIKGDGLGPMHNATSCAECHIGGGGSGVKKNVTLLTIDPRNDFVAEHRAKAQTALTELHPSLIRSSGFLSLSIPLHNRSTRSGYDEIRNRIRDHVPSLHDEWFVPEKRTAATVAKRPVVAGRYKSIDYYLSQRNTPALYGIGQIESISTERLRGLAKRQAINTNGRVTGRVAGKFGWRGQVSSLSQFVTQACSSELGLKSEFSSQDNDPTDFQYVSIGNDITSDQVMQLTAFVQSIPRPIENRENIALRKQIDQGEEWFREVGCGVCHVEDLHPTSGMFSDLLLHDMGIELQDPSPAPLGDQTKVSLRSTPRFKPPPFLSGSTTPQYYGNPDEQFFPTPYPFSSPASPQFPRGSLPDEFASDHKSMSWEGLQREWKTPPLWGVADTGPYLHDGRAATIEQAIMYHGGEAEQSRDRFKSLSNDKRKQLITFLKSLKAPQD